MPLIEISNLDFAFGERLVLKHINLAVESGSTLGLIGPNGGGKTTLLRLLLGLISPTRGKILIDGMSPKQATRQGGVIGYLPQRAVFVDKFPVNVRQCVRMGLVGKTGLLRGFAKPDLQFVESLLDRIELRDLADIPIGELSGGQQQRVFIAQAVAARPKLLLLDEPTTGIDHIGQQRFIEFIEKLKKELELTVIFSSHDLRAVRCLSDRIACLNVTLHYHDLAEHLPADLVYKMFACDLEAFGKKSAVGDDRPPVLGSGINEILEL